MLCLCARVHVVAGVTDIPLICNWGQFVTGCKLFREAYCIRGHFVFGGYCPLWPLEWAAYGRVAFIRGLFARDSRARNIFFYFFRDG